MQSRVNLLIALLLILSQTTQASEGRIFPDERLDREAVKRALLVLIQSGALTRSETGALVLDERTLKELRDEGFIRRSKPEVSTVCIDIMN